MVNLFWRVPGTMNYRLRHEECSGVHTSVEFDTIRVDGSGALSLYRDGKHVGNGSVGMYLRLIGLEKLKKQILDCLDTARAEALAECVYQKTQGVDIAIEAVRAEFQKQPSQ